jgi:hypothetical protein
MLHASLCASSNNTLGNGCAERETDVGNAGTFTGGFTRCSLLGGLIVTCEHDQNCGRPGVGSGGCTWVAPRFQMSRNAQGMTTMM